MTASWRGLRPSHAVAVGTGSWVLLLGGGLESTGDGNVTLKSEVIPVVLRKSRMKPNSEASDTNFYNCKDTIKR